MKIGRTNLRVRFASIATAAASPVFAPSRGDAQHMPVEGAHCTTRRRQARDCFAFLGKRCSVSVNDMLFRTGPRGASRRADVSPVRLPTSLHSTFH